MRVIAIAMVISLVKTYQNRSFKLSSLCLKYFEQNDPYSMELKYSEAIEVLSYIAVM